ncbi:MAG TPA: DUF6186 family protein [Acidimicrobiales bacterium]|nr:DUF6186 family protein [Acidimicrobiales bacterium]
MPGEAAWIAVACAALAWEVAARRGRGHATFAEALSAAERARAGRALLFLLWAFAGYHLFVRYGVAPR